MKILYIDKVYNISDIRPGEQEIFNKELPKLGHQVYFLLKKNKLNNLKLNSDENITSYYNNIFSQIIKLYKIIQVRKIKYVVIRNIISFSLISLLFKLIFNIKVIFIRPFPSEEFAIYGAYKKLSKYKYLSLIKNTLRLLFICNIMRMSDLVVARSEQFKKYLKDNFNIYKNVIFVPMGFSFSWINKGNNKNEIKKTFSERYNIDLKERILIYFGAMDHLRNIEFCIDVLKNVLSKIKNVKLILVGGFALEIEKLKKYADKVKISDHVIFTGVLERSELFDLIAISDLSISPIPPIECYKISSPTKVVESIGMGIPVIANREIYDQYKVITESGCGICVDYNAQSFADAIIKIIESGNKMEYSRKGPDYIRKNRDYSILTKVVENKLILL